jgi:hypothetical protein
MHACHEVPRSRMLRQVHKPIIAMALRANEKHCVVAGATCVDQSPIQAALDVQAKITFVPFDVLDGSSLQYIGNADLLQQTCC